MKIATSIMEYRKTIEKWKWKRIAFTQIWNEKFWIEEWEWDLGEKNVPGNERMNGIGTSQVGFEISAECWINKRKILLHSPVTSSHHITLLILLFSFSHLFIIICFSSPYFFLFNIIIPRMSIKEVKNPLLEFRQTPGRWSPS